MTELATTTDRQEVALTKAGLDHTRDQLDLLEGFVQDVLRKDHDYGVIPGTPKSSLWKPGALNVIAAFNCHVEPHCTHRIIDPATGFVHFEYRANVIHNVSGQVRSSGEGSCNSYEVKYRYRDSKRTCPSCNAPAIIKGKEEFGGGWVCWGKQGGCGSKFSNGAQSIEGQTVGRIQTEDPFDQMNTYQKMAIKRAVVDAALGLPGVARFFTQDLEEDKEREVDGRDDESGTQPSQQSQSRPQAHGQQTRTNGTALSRCDEHRIAYDKDGKHPIHDEEQELVGWCQRE